MALRSVLKYDDPPWVSIDPAPKDSDPNKQLVSFGKKLENTKFGMDLLAADLILKKLGLGKLNAEIWGVRSYFDLSVDEWRRTGNEDPLVSRFWFLVDHTRTAISRRKDIGLVKRLKIKVQTEVNASSSTKRKKSATLVDEIGNLFANNLTEALDDVMLNNPDLRRLDQLYRLVGIASVMKLWRDKYRLKPETIGLTYWLNDFKVEKKKTKPTVKLLVSTTPKDPGKGRMKISGGIELNALTTEVKGGSLTALKELVVKSKPSNNALFWLVPIGDALDKIADTYSVGKYPQSRSEYKAGMYLFKNFSHDNNSVNSFSRSQFQAAVFKVSSEPIRSIGDSWRHEDFHIGGVPQDRIGGVLLRNVAKIEGKGKSLSASLSKGDFALLLNDENSKLKHFTFRKFVTALWCVYFGNTYPGLSIDSIAPGAKKQLVRYIGRIKNTDLARVMLEADYLMKQWAVGTASPKLDTFDTFKTPDEYAAKRGTAYVNCISRFWFIPNEMIFKDTGNAIIFESGNMAVKTEILLRNDNELKADPANEDFATWFTKYYKDIALKYPIYDELEEYAKLVSLANYVDDSEIPLLWYLVSHRNLVLSENSPGTVDALFAKSKKLKNVTIEGGVQLESQTQYILDKEARIAIADAYARLGDKRYLFDSKLVEPTANSYNTNYHKKSHITVVPQHSLSAGIDYLGVRYQTDLSINEEGLNIDSRAIKNLKRNFHNYFFRNIMRPKIKNIFYPDGSIRNARNFEHNYAQAWKESTDNVEMVIDRLRPLMNKTYNDTQIFKKDVDNELQGDELGDISKIICKSAYFRRRLDLVRYYSNSNNFNYGAFGKNWSLLIPYRIDLGRKTIAYGNLQFPKEIFLTDLLHKKQEILKLRFDNNTNTFLYSPISNTDTLTLNVTIISDGGFRLNDRLGSVFEFNASGQMKSMIFSEVYRMSFERGPLFSFTKKPYHLSALMEGAFQKRGHF